MKENIRIAVEKVRVEGRGVLLLTGPSGCGKGEIAKALCKFLSIPKEKHLSMGDILRKTVIKAKENEKFMNTLGEKYNISKDISVLDEQKNGLEVVQKVKNHYNDIISFLDLKDNFISQFHWLEFCVANGLLIPDEWTESIIDALLESTPELHKEIFILDGYPRTVNAGKNLLKTLDRLNIPVIKVLHLFITKEQMKLRAFNRGRIDDTQDSLERRYQFYIDKVQPCIDYLKSSLGSSMVSLIDAHQPVYDENGQINIDASINEVVINVMHALGLPKFLMDLK
ncbi:MAG: adenylate kinase [Clostridiaceae bacterium]|jgi:adenylate kinase family enzyme|nr:adenylate kinase [Clostridiaceae bacterium]